MLIIKNRECETMTVTVIVIIEVVIDINNLCRFTNTFENTLIIKNIEVKI